MGAKAGRKGGRSYNLLTCGVSAWRKYLDKRRRKSAKKAAIDEQEWYPWGDKRYDRECTCGQITRNAATCPCGCGICCPEERGG